MEGVAEEEGVGKRFVGVEGIEPSSKVLETSILPLNYTPMVLPSRIELLSEVPQTSILSVKLQELNYILSQILLYSFL